MFPPVPTPWRERGLELHPVAGSSFSNKRFINIASYFLAGEILNPSEWRSGLFRKATGLGIEVSFVIAMYLSVAPQHPHMCGGIHGIHSERRQCLLCKSCSWAILGIPEL